MCQASNRPGEAKCLGALLLGCLSRFHTLRLIQGGASPNILIGTTSTFHMFIYSYQTKDKSSINIAFLKGLPGKIN